MQETCFSENHTPVVTNGQYKQDADCAFYTKPSNCHRKYVFSWIFCSKKYDKMDALFDRL